MSTAPPLCKTAHTVTCSIFVANRVQGRPSGVLIVTDTTPEEPVEYVKVNKPSMNSSAGVYH
jgi:hypothetical protein